MTGHALFVALFFSALQYCQFAFSAEWQPADGPLMTKWANDVSPDNVHPEYPRPQMVRERWMNLNGLWQLAFAEAGEAPPLGRELPEQILVPFPVESALSGVMKRADRLWYRRTVEIPDEWSGDDLLLHFGAVDWEATVYFNGHKLGVHRGGYDAFQFEVSQLLRDEGPQEIVVGVFDPTNAGTQPRGKQVNNPRGIYYTPTTGIWQTVWLEPVPRARIDSIHVVPDVDGGQAKINVSAARTNENHTIEAVVSAGTLEVARIERPAGEPIVIDLPDARLWSPDDPFLYDVHVSLGDGRRTVDEVDSYFGMRKIEVAKDDAGVNRILLNGEFVFQVGPLDQGFWPDGLYTAPTDEALRYDVEITKRLGFNMTRKHVKVEPARWYTWCDRLGLLVWQDMPSGDRSVRRGEGEMTRTEEAARQFELELRRMIEGRRSHPSIVMWVVFNEGWGQFDTVRLTNWVKQFDPTRLANCASGWNDYPAGDVLDIHAYPGPRAPDPQPDRAGVLGEFGGLGLGVDGHRQPRRTHPWV
jgi:beta-galactosidase/beta-glucuronidase